MSVNEGMEISIMIVFSIMGSLLFFILYNVLKFVSEKLTLLPPIENNQNNNPQDIQNIEGECCICLQQYQNRVSLLCNHTFCGLCLMDYYDRIVRPNSLKCLICRRGVTIIISNFQIADNTRDLYDRITRYNKMNTTGFNFYYYYIMDLPQLFYRGIIEIFSSAIAVITFIIFFILIIFYIYLPYDIIPDNLGVLGLLDDFVFLTGIIIWVVEKFYSGFRNQVNSDFENIRAR